VRTSPRRVAVVAPAVLVGVLALLWTTTTATRPVRIQPVALEAADAAVGLWQRGETILDVPASGEVRYVADPVACRVGTVQGKDFTKVAEGQYTVSNGNFAAEGCTAGSFTPGFGLQVTGDALTAGGGKPWNRIKPTTLTANDAIVGQWASPDGTRTNEVRLDGSVRILKGGPACRVGQLDSYDLKPSTTPGTYTAKDGDFTAQECAAHSFARTATLTVSPDGKQLTVAGQPDKWLKLTGAPRQGTDSFHLFHYNMPNGAWVVCGVLVKNKTDEVQLLLANLGVEAPGLYGLPVDKVAKQDGVLHNRDIGGEVVEDVILPWTQARDEVSLAPPRTSKQAELDEDFRDNFQITCARRK
jgi:hypothetical protein